MSVLTQTSPRASEPIISIENLTKGYAGNRQEEALQVVNQLNLQINTGEFVALVGPSGCGKTTVLKMVAGLEPYDIGVVKVRGEVVRSVPPNIGFVFQEPALLPWRSVRRNVEMGMYARRLNKVETKNVVNHYLELTGLSDFGAYLPYQLSGGMQQRVAIARALVGEPDLLLMDEPFGSLDAITRARLQDELLGIIESTSTTTVLVTHDLEEGLYLSDRMAVFGPRPVGMQLLLEVPLKRPRSRVEFIEAQELIGIRRQVLEVLNS
jgi:ABC-type nitrate/sulfonate/bicarbonate transport system ATPase subunit